MEEMCRELGDRGRVSSLAKFSASDMQVVPQRVQYLADCLRQVAAMLITTRSLNRQKRKALAMRADVLLEQLEAVQESIVKGSGQTSNDSSLRRSWATVEWTLDEISDMATTCAALSSNVERTDDQSVVVIESLLAAMETLAAAHKGQSQDIHMTLSAGGEPAQTMLRATMEHALEVLDAISIQTPRKQRKLVDGACQRVESIVEDGAAGGLLHIIATKLATQALPHDSLAWLVGMVATIQQMRVGYEGNECLVMVTEMLDFVESHSVGGLK